MDPEGPITFREPSFAIFDDDAGAVRTTPLGNLAIFSTRGMAEAVARTSRSRLRIIEVWITPREGKTS